MAEERSPQAVVADVGAAARHEAAALAAHGRGLDAAGWEAPSWCQGWSVREVVAHLTEGTERFGMQTRAALAGEPVPEFSQAQRDARREQVKALPPAELLSELERRTATFFDYTDGLPADDLTRPVVPLPAGRLTAVQVVQLRLNELALHRWDVLAPTDPAATVDADSAALVLDYVLAGAGRLAKREMLEGLEAVYRCETSGPGGGPVTIVCHNGAVQVAREAPPTADVTATFRLPVEALIRLLWGRLSLERALADGTVQVAGDRDAALALGPVFGNR